MSRNLKAALACLIAGGCGQSLKAQTPAPPQGVWKPDVAVQVKTFATDEEIFLSGIFEEALIPMTAEAVIDENAALGAAMTAFLQSGNREDISPFQAFIAAHPQSRWNASLSLNLGLLSNDYGYLSRAFSLWESAWQLAKNETDPMRKTVADRAIGEILLLNARLGRMDRLQELLAELGERHVHGSVAACVNAARDGLQSMRTMPQRSFRCGPYALNSILEKDKAVKSRHPLVEAAVSTVRGTNLVQVQALATQLGLDYQMARRSPGAPLIYPSVFHWRLDHFAAMLREKDGRYLVQDATFGGREVWMTQTAIDAESDGYFLVPAGALPAGWTAVAAAEGENVWGKGAADSTNQDTKTTCPPSPTGGNTSGECPGMPVADYFLLQATLNIRDTPIFYAAPYGPDMYFSLNYNHLEQEEPGLIDYPNFGPGWDFNWISYLTVEPSNNLIVNLRGGGVERYNYSQVVDNLSSSYQPDPFSQAVMTRKGPGVYHRKMLDGTEEVYNHAAGSNGRLYLTKVTTPDGNSVTINYDAKGRITTIQDSHGRPTTFAYKNETATNAGFRKIASITDPFSRSATFEYDVSMTYLVKITDAIGMASEFQYDTDGANGVHIRSMTTPYGKTSFEPYTKPGAETLDPPVRGLKITYPNGSASVVESWAGHIMNTYHWGKLAYKRYPNDPENRVYDHCDTYHWLLDPGTSTMTPTMSWSKRPLETEIKYDYEGASSVTIDENTPPTPDDPSDDSTHSYRGATDQATTVTRVVPNKYAELSDDETGQNQTVQTSSAKFNLQGNLMETTDPKGRHFKYAYTGDNIDLTEVRQKRDGNNDLLLKVLYNSKRLPDTVTDAAGSKTVYQYNARGQITQIKNALNEITTASYNTDGTLYQIDGPLAGSADVTTFTYDTKLRVQSITDAEGYTVEYEYDNLNRMTKVTYPDNTYEEIVWRKLDPHLYRDRQGRFTTYEYNEMRQLVAKTDAQQIRVEYVWCTCGLMVKLKDGRGNVTEWVHDDLGRITKKIHADEREHFYTYDSAGRLKTFKNARGEIKTYYYDVDNRIAFVKYTNTVNPTPDVTFQYDQTYGRLASISSSVGTITYRYNGFRQSPLDPPLFGAGALDEVEDSRLAAVISYTYDALGRTVGRDIDDANASSIGYDAAGRVFGLSDLLGGFTYTYLNPSKGMSRLASISYPNGQSTTFSWEASTEIHRLASMTHMAGGSTLSNFAYTYSPANQIRNWTQTEGSATASRWEIGQDNADRLRSVVVRNNVTDAITKQYYYSYDASGNRTTAQEDTTVVQSTFNEINQIETLPSSGAIRFEGTLDEPGTVTLNGAPARMLTGTHFETDLVLPSGTTSHVYVAATDGNNNQSTQEYLVNVPATGGMEPEYDADGNTISNGRGHTYAWDAESRLISITYGDDSKTEFTYDALSRRVAVVEKDSAGTETSAKHLLWDGLSICEERNALHAVTKRYHANGFTDGQGAKYFYTRDHLGSVREVVDESGVVTDRYRYDPYGKVTRAFPVFPSVSSLKVRLKADSGITKDANNKVSQWNSETGSQFHAFASTNTAEQPTWVSSGTPTGKPVVRFDGIDDFLEGALGNNSNDSNLTVFVVHRRSGGNSTQAPLSLSGMVPANDPDNSTSPAYALTWQNSELAVAITGTSSSSPQLSVGGEFQVTTLVKSGTTQVTAPWNYSASLTLYNRNSYGSTQSTSVTHTTEVWNAPKYVLGRLLVQAGTGDGFFNGDIAEVIVCGSLSTAQRQAIESYLATTYLQPQSSDFRYTGHYYHEKSDLHLAPYRAYDGTIGRWISEDPIREAGGINLYGYIGNQPLSGFDPLGLDGINLLSPYESGLHATADSMIKGRSDVFIVAGHSSGSGKMVDNTSTYGSGGPALDAELILRMMLDKGYKMGTPVALFGCEGAAGNNSLAKQLAMLTGGLVGGASECIYAGGSAPPSISGQRWSPYHRDMVRDPKKPGRMRWFDGSGSEIIPQSYNRHLTNGGQPNEFSPTPPRRSAPTPFP